MKATPKLEQSAQEEQMRAVLNAHWQASAAGNASAEHDINDDDAICDYPQSGERILGRKNCRPCEVIIPASPPASTFVATSTRLGGPFVDFEGGTQ